MSLMDEMKNVVDTGRELLSTVSGKMKQIDDKVDEAVAGVPAEILSNMARTVYIDQLNGDDNNAGTSRDKAFRSIGHVASITPSSASIEIVLVSDYQFAEGERCNFDNNSVWIRSESNNNRHKMLFSAFVSEAGEYTCNNFYAGRNCYFNFSSMILVLPPEPNSSGTYSKVSSLIGSNSTFDVGTPLSIRMSGVDILFPESGVSEFNITVGYNMVMFSISSFSAPQEWIDGAHLLYRMAGVDARINARLYYDSEAIIPS